MPYTEAEEEKSVDEPPLLPTGEFGFAPVVKRPEVPNPSELEVEVSESGVSIPKSLFSEKAPIVDKVKDVKEEAKEKPEINLENQKSTANVKRPMDLFGLIPGLMGRGVKNAPKPKDSVKKDKNPDLTGLDESMDLPAFLRRR